MEFCYFLIEQQTVAAILLLLFQLLFTLSLLMRAKKNATLKIANICWYIKRKKIAQSTRQY